VEKGNVLNESVVIPALLDSLECHADVHSLFSRNNHHSTAISGG